MNRVFTALSLALLPLSAMAHQHNSHQDIRVLHPNELSLAHLSSSTPAASTKGSARASVPYHLARNASEEASAEGDVVEAEVVVFYQPSYAATYGEYAMHQRIRDYFEYANNTYAEHDYHYRLSPVDIVPVTSIPDDLPLLSTFDENGIRLKRGANAEISAATLNEVNYDFEPYPEYAIYQTKWQADLVVYFREHRASAGSIRGLAGIGGELSNIIDDNRGFTGKTLAHEIGHNLGLNHEEERAYVGPDYARAWVCGGKRTIMYSSSNSLLSLPHYSSPEKFYEGEPCGDELLGDNARVIRENFVTTSQRRSGVEKLGHVSFTATRFAGTEEEGVMITLARTGDINDPASVKVFAKDGEAVWGQDYTDAFILAEFAAGEATTSVIYPTVNDAEDEGEETFTVSLLYPYRLSVDDTVATLTVSDVIEEGNAGIFTLSGATELTEGDTPTYTVTRTGGVGEVVVNVTTQDGDADAGVDFVHLNAQLVFKEGDIEQTVTLVSINNDEPESTETFTVSLASTSQTAQYDISSLEVTIDDDDELTVTPTTGTFVLEAESTSISESSNFSARFKRVDGFDGEVNVRVFTRDGTAIAGVDYEALETVQKFADGVTTDIIGIVVNIIDNELVEEDKTFTLHLEVLGSDMTQELTVTITNDDTQTPTSSNPSQPVNNAPSSSSGGGSTGVWGVFLLALLFLKRGRKSPY
jgi:hypothetical protein